MIQYVFLELKILQGLALSKILVLLQEEMKIVGPIGSSHKWEGEKLLNKRNKM